MKSKATGETVAIEANLPSSELNRLLDDLLVDFPELAVKPASAPTRRGIEVAVAVALITGTVTILLPFVTRLAERLFKAEPNATVALKPAENVAEIILDSSIPAPERERLVAAAIGSGRAVRIQIKVA